MNWLPIKTAPEHTMVIIWDNYYDAIHMAAKDDWWQTIEGSDDINPTHWMPLPDPPTEEKQ